MRNQEGTKLSNRSPTLPQCFLWAPRCDAPGNHSRDLPQPPPAGFCSALPGKTLSKIHTSSRAACVDAPCCSSGFALVPSSLGCHFWPAHPCLSHPCRCRLPAPELREGFRLSRFSPPAPAGWDGAGTQFFPPAGKGW